MPFLNISNLKEISVEISPDINKNGVLINILRLDKIHPVISGNKIFKLIEYLDEALQTEEKTLLTFGGAYSNHLHATGFVCHQSGIKSIGIVRGETIEMNSPTLTDCLSLGMELHFIGRNDFKKIAEVPRAQEIYRQFGKCTIVPAGGYGKMGASGASKILDFIPLNTFTYIGAAVGTATTLAGLMYRERTEKILAFPALKGMTDMPVRLNHLGAKSTNRLITIPDYHFGGFGKKRPELLNFMNSFYTEYHIPLDFVYTGKMMYGIFDLAEKGFFPPGSKILAIHSGGLQGNRSLPDNALIY